MSVDITLNARDRISQQMDAITRSVNELNSAFEELEGVSRAAGNKASASLNGIASASKLAGKGLTTVGSTLTNFITKPALAAGAALGGVVLAKGFKRFAQIDEAKAKMIALGVSAEQAGKIINENAMQAVIGTSYNLDEAATTAAGAFAAGIKGNDLTKYLSTVTDAAAVAGVGMGEMGTIFNRVAANGKVTAMEMNQLADRGVPIWQYLADATGKSVEEVRKDVSAGAIDIATFRKAIDENISGAAKKMGQISWSGMVSNIEASLGRIGASIWGATDDATSLSGVLLELGNKAMGPLGDVEKKAAELGRTLGGTARLLTDFFSGGVDLETFNGVSKGAQDLFKKIQPMAEKIKGINDAFSGMSTKGKLSFAGIALGAGPVLKIAGKLSSKFGEVAPKLGDMVAKAGGFSGIASKLLSPLGIGVGLFAGMFLNSEKLRSSFGDVIEAMGPGLGDVLSSIASNFGAIFGAIGNILGSLGDAFAPLISAAAPVLGSIASLFGAIFKVISPIISAIAQLVGWFASKMAGPAQTAAGAISKAFGGVAAVINGVANAINAVRSAWDSIKSGSKTLTIYQNTVGTMDSIKGGNGLAGPKAATGTKSSKGGTTLVGERGPELVNLPKGASVHTARETSAMLSSPSVSVNIVANVSDKGMSIEQFVSELADEVSEVLSASAEGVCA